MDPVIGLVGPCTSGKSTIRTLLESEGYQTRHIAQEHSFVQDMWQVVAHPDLLVFLDVSYEETLRRRDQDWTLAEYEVQQRRLAHARQHADLVIMTDGLAPLAICARILGVLKAPKPGRS